ncbi:MAG: helix-turn-helix transcriptional regulator [Pseudodonghicola sp.]|nr:helix-turn-helix transcriptional regulator [Pseudodonghicola sp.]
MRLKISEMRKAAGMTQEELAKRVGLSRPYLAQLENATRSLKTSHQAVIAEALGVDPQDLVDFTAPDPADETLILRAFRSMTKEQRKALVGWARATLSEGEAEEGN